MFHFHIDKTMVIPLGENANTDGAVLVHHDSLLLGKEHQPQNCKAVQAQYHAEFDKLKKRIGEKEKEFEQRRQAAHYQANRDGILSHRAAH